MARHVMKLPDVGEGVVDAEVVEWKIKPGDHVDEDQHLVDIMTDKATVEMTAPVSGMVVEIFGEPGDRVAVGSELVIFETEAIAADEDRVSTPPEATETRTEHPPAAPVAASPPAGRKQDPERAADPDRDVASVAGGRRAAAPTVRRRAREAHVDLAQIPGTGRGGRITHQDLDDFITSGSAAGEPATADFVAPAKVVAGADGVREIKVIGMRRVIAEKMAQSKRNIPHFAYVEEVDVTDLEQLRQHLNTTRRPDQPKLTYLPFIMKAMIKALGDFPQCNCRYDEEAGVINEYQAVHVGIATQTDGGLMVPVVRHAEARDIWGSAEEMQRISQAARDGRAAREELTGSTITITSLGALGGIVSTPVINYPEVAIIGVNKSVERPMIRDGEVVTRLMMNLSSSFDHRIVDGYDAARFIQAIRSLLEYPATIFV